MTKFSGTPPNYPLAFIVSPVIGGMTAAVFIVLLLLPAGREDIYGLFAAGAATALMLENQRLDAELRARLVELRASRARLVEAADGERRRLERDLHDGAQSRLVALALIGCAGWASGC